MDAQEYVPTRLKVWRIQKDMCRPPLKLLNDPPNPLGRGGRGLQLLFEQCTHLPMSVSFWRRV